MMMKGIIFKKYAVFFIPGDPRATVSFFVWNFFRNILEIESMKAGY